MIGEIYKKKVRKLYKMVSVLFYLLFELFNAYLRKVVVSEKSIGEVSADCAG